MSIMPFIDRAAPLPLDAAIQALGNNPQGAGFDLAALRGYIRDRGTPANGWLGDASARLSHAAPSAKFVVNRHGLLVSGTTLRCDHDPATLDTSATPSHSLPGSRTLTIAGSAVYSIGQIVSVSLTADITKFMLGRVTAWNGGTKALTIAVYAASGVFTGSAWTVIVALGLPVEEQRTNGLLRSDDLSSGSWAKTGATIAANVATAPDGTMTADKIVEDSSTGQHGVAQTTGSPATTYSTSFWAKAAERSWLFFQPVNTSSGVTAYVNLATGAIGNTTGIVTASTKRYPTGWWRIQMIYATLGSSICTVRAATRNGAVSYAGDGSSGIYVWGLQAEIGWSAPSSYIPTAGSAVTRAADQIGLATSAFPYNGGAGVLTANGSPVSPTIVSSELRLPSGNLLDLRWVPS